MEDNVTLNELSSSYFDSDYDDANYHNFIKSKEEEDEQTIKNQEHYGL